MNSYNKTFLEKIAKDHGFLRDNLEKVIRLTEILKYLNQSEHLKNILALKGGTAINLTLFQIPRLSVDIDLDFTNNCPKEEMIEMRQEVNHHVITYMEHEGYVMKSGSKSPHTLDSWVLGYTNAGGNQDNIKIEINYSNRCHVLPVVERTVNIDFLSHVKINTLSPIELFASKINALINRAAVRDVYDVYGMIRANLFESEEERTLLRKIFVFYLAVGSNCKAEEVSLSHDGYKCIETLTYSQVRSHLFPVLRRGEKFELNIVKAEVTSFLNAFMSFSEEEYRFIKHFNNRDYRPDILFSEEDLAERVATHPMALWKCRPAPTLL